jgi:hypothetical protein
MTLIFLKRFDILDFQMWRYYLKWIMVPVIPVAIMINVFRYLVIIPKSILMLISISVLYILIIYLIIKNSYSINKNIYLKTIIFLMLSIVIWGTLENITYPILLFLIDKSLGTTTDNILWNFILTIPSRVIGYTIIAYIIIKNNRIINIRLFEIITKNRLYSSILLFLTISFNIISVYLIKLVGYDKILDSKTLIEKIVISEIILVFPIIVIFLMVVLINDLIIKERSIRQSYENLVIQDDIMTDVED